MIERKRKIYVNNYKKCKTGTDNDGKGVCLFFLLSLFYGTRKRKKKKDKKKE